MSTSGQKRKPNPPAQTNRYGRVVSADFFGASPVASAFGIRSGATPCGQSITASGAARAQRTLQRQSILAVRLHDGTLLAGFADGQLSGAFGTLGGVHDLVAQLVIVRLFAHLRQSLFDICFLDLAPWRRRGGRRPGGGEPQSPGIELQQSRRERGGITELETKFDGRQLRRRPCEQQITVADRMQSAGTSKGAANLVAANRFADMMHHDESGAGSVAQAKQRKTERRHSSHLGISVCRLLL